MTIDRQLIQTLMYFGLFLEFLTAIFSYRYWRWYKHIPVLKYMPIFLTYLCINEMVGLISRVFFDHYILFNYNLYDLINFTYFLLVYAYNFNVPKYTKIISMLTLVYIIIHIGDLFFEDYILELQTFPHVMGSLFLMIAIALYGFQITTTKTTYIIRTDVLFWIGVGSLFYYLGNTPFSIIRNYYQKYTQSHYMLFTNHCLAIIMYVCFCIGFITSKNVKKP